MSWWPWNWGKNGNKLLAEFWEFWENNRPLVLRAATSIVASMPLFFVGLFASVGALDYFLLIDRGSMLASLLFYTALLSFITVTVSFVPCLFTHREDVQWLARAIALVVFLLAVIGLEYAVMLALPVACICLLVWRKCRHDVPNDHSWLNRLLGRPPRVATDWTRLLMHLLPVVLVCCPALGYLRGEYLRDQKPSMIVHLADTQEPKLVTVIMRFDQGVLVFEPPSPHARLYLRIASIEPAPAEGEGFRLRHWRNAVYDWTGETLAKGRSWLWGK